MMPTATTTSDNPVLAIADSLSGGDANTIYLLSTGVKVHILSVAATLIDDVRSRIHEPDIPVWHNPDKDRDEPNPSDPTYLQALMETNQQRAKAVIDCLLMFGVELVEGVPAEDDWLERLGLLETLGALSLTGFDLHQPLHREYLYKRYVVVGNDDLEMISAKSGLVSAEDVARMKQFFRRAALRAVN